MTIEIVDFPINSMVIFHSYVKLPEGSNNPNRDVLQALGSSEDMLCHRYLPDPWDSEALKNSHPFFKHETSFLRNMFSALPTMWGPPVMFVGL